MISRRTFLAGLGATAGATLLGRDVLAGAPTTGDSSFADATRTPHKILEIFLYGGLSPWESFFCIPAERPQLYPGALATEYANVDVTIGGACTAAGPPSVALDRGTYRYGDLRLGKGALPLVARADMLARTRVVTLQSEISNHVLGIPLALTGRRFGDPRAASLGAAVQRRHATDGPVSFVIMPPSDLFAGSGGDYAAFEAFFATGSYPANSRPVRLDLVPSSSGTGDDVEGWARRSSSTPERDTLARAFAAQYTARFGSTRASTARTFQAVVDGMNAAPSIGERFALTRAAASRVTNVAHCHSSLGAGRSTTRESLALARELFSRGAKYVGVVDTGIGRDTSAGYDGHGGVARLTTPNLYHLLSELASHVGPGKISLDDTVIVLKSEMGRTATAQSGIGRDHYGKAAVAVLIGGPPPTRRMIGEFDFAGDGPIGRYTHANLSNALLIAAGVDQRHPENFAEPERAGNFLT